MCRGASAGREPRQRGRRRLSLPAIAAILTPQNLQDRQPRPPSSLPNRPDSFFCAPHLSSGEGDAADPRPRRSSSRISPNISPPRARHVPSSMIARIFQSGETTKTTSQSCSSRSPSSRCVTLVSQYFPRSRIPDIDRRKPVRRSTTKPSSSSSTSIQRGSTSLRIPRKAASPTRLQKNLAWSSIVRGGRGHRKRTPTTVAHVSRTHACQGIFCRVRPTLTIPSSRWPGRCDTGMPRSPGPGATPSGGGNTVSCRRLPPAGPQERGKAPLPGRLRSGNS